MTNIKLSKRLECIADMVDNSSVIADIGCDHALLDIYLSQKKIIKKSIACDITIGALDQAKKNISINNIKNIDTRLGDGLEPINDDDNIDTIVMSGLGDQKIINVLDSNKNKLKSVNSIIIQSNTGIYNIRKYLTSIGYFIENEKLIKERNIIYVVIKFSKGNNNYTKKELMYGPLLLNNKDNLFNELLINKINKNNYVIRKLPSNKIIKKIVLKLRNLRIKSMLKKN